MDIVLAADTRFAVATPSTFVEADAGRQMDVVRAAEAKVHDRLERTGLYVASFPPDVIDELRGTLTYPPDGSPKAKRT